MYNNDLSQKKYDKTVRFQFLSKTPIFIAFRQMLLQIKNIVLLYRLEIVSYKMSKIGAYER